MRKFFINDKPIQLCTFFFNQSLFVHKINIMVKRAQIFEAISLINGENYLGRYCSSPELILLVRQCNHLLSPLSTETRVNMNLLKTLYQIP